MADAYPIGGEPESIHYDLCLIFPRKVNDRVRFGAADDDDIVQMKKLVKPDDNDVQKMRQWEKFYQQSIMSMRGCGLTVYCYHSRDRDKIVCKVGADTERLKTVAAQTKHMMQLKSEYSSAWAQYVTDFPGRPEVGFKDKREVSKLYKTVKDSGKEDSFGAGGLFKTIDRIKLIHHILTSGDKGCAGIKIAERCHKDGLKYFPLHEEKVRHKLEKDWLPWLICKSAFATRLRDYLGARDSLYFIWMAFYWKWLVAPAAIGFLLCIWDIIVQNDDNAADIPYCIFLSIWCTYLPHFWRREQSKHAIEWGTLDLVPEYEPCMPEHQGELKINTITDSVEPFYPPSKRYAWYCLSSVVIGCVTIGVIAGMLIVFIARHFMHDEFPGGKLSFYFIMAMCVQLANWGLGNLARKLTAMENHRTKKDFDVHLLAKCIVFKFVASYSPLYYIAFIKRYSPTGRCSERKDECFHDLEHQLAIFMLVRLFINNFFDWILPRLNIWMNKRRDRVTVEASPAEQQATYSKFSTFDNYDEVLITHGYATFFAVTCPWVTGLVLLGTIGEIFLDAKSLTTVKQRPFPTAQRNNEPWDSAFEIFGIIAATTNMALIIFGSDEYEGWRLTEKAVLFLAIEHFLILANIAVRWALPEVPVCVSNLSLRHESIVGRVFGHKVGGLHVDDFGGMYGDRGGMQIEILGHDLEDDDDNDAPVFSMTEAPGEVTRGMKDGLKTMKEDVFGTVGKKGGKA